MQLGNVPDFGLFYWKKVLYLKLPTDHHGVNRGGSLKNMFDRTYRLHDAHESISSVEFVGVLANAGQAFLTENIPT